MVAVKIAQIMKENKLIKKDGKIDLGGNKGYTVLTERKVLEVLRPAFIEKELIVVPKSVQHLSRSGSVTSLGMEFAIIDTTDNDVMTCASVGQGASTGDKGAGSAFTYCLKYLLMKVTMMMSGDDPDQVGDIVHEEEETKNMDLAVALAQEISLLIKGKMITPEIGASLVAALKENANDPLYLKEAGSKIQKMKETMK